MPSGEGEVHSEDGADAVPLGLTVVCAPSVVVVVAVGCVVGEEEEVVEVEEW